MRNYKEQSEKILELAGQKKKAAEKRKNILVTASSLAACAVIAVFCTSLFSDSQQSELPVSYATAASETNIETSEKGTDSKASTANKNKTTATIASRTTAKAKTTAAKTTEVVITPTKPTVKNTTDFEKYLSLNGLIENTDDVIIYNGNSYVNTCSVDADANSKQTLLNQFLEKTNGSLDTEATDEITSNVSGKVYSVNGYSEDFRLCIYAKDKSAGTSSILIFDNLHSLKTSDIKYGSELFNDTLHIDTNLNFINYYSGSNLNIAPFNQVNILKKIDEKAQNTLLQTINDSYLIDSDEYIYDDESKSVVLYLTMTDQTTTEIYLTEGGYIFCSGLYFKTDSSAFSEIYNILTGE